MIARDDKAQARKSIIASLAIGAMLVGAAMALSAGSVASQNLAVAQEQTGNATTISNTTSTDTFMAKGVIGGTVSESGSSSGNQTATAGSNSSSGNATSAAGNQTQTAAASSSSGQFIAAGDWTMDVNGGNITDFRANFTVVKTDATQHHSHDITNFKLGNNTNVQLDPTGRTSVNGSADIMINGTDQWPGVDTTLTIDKAKVLTIQPEEDEAAQHFGGQPIYGIVTSITGENGTQIADTIPAGGNQTQQEEGGGILDPLTEPLEDLFGGGQ